MFGAAYIIDVLLGKDNERIRNFGHNEISTYGIGKEHNAKEWKSIVRQLVARNFLYVDIDGYNGLHITEQGAAFLKTKENIEIRLDPKAAILAKSSTKKMSPDLILDKDEDIELFTELKNLRLSIATKKKIPPYVVFHDKTLIDMAAKRPASIEEMSLIHGIGASKLKKYGQIFLDEIKKGPR